MPNRGPNPGLFKRWLVLVYLPLGIFVVSLALIAGKILTGPLVWLVALLGIYCVVPARLILETQRKGLELPKPPGSKGSHKAPARRTKPEPAPDEHEAGFEIPRPAGRTKKPVSGDSGLMRERPEAATGPNRGGAIPAARAKQARTVSERVERPRKPAVPKKSAQVIRRRALASVIGIGVLLGVGGILVIIGIGRVTSSFGLVMVGVGGFLMILSVTLPTFRLVDAALRGVGRLLSRRPTPTRGAKQD